MNKYLKYLKSIGIFLLSVLIINLLITIIHYFDFFNLSTIKVLKLLSVIISSLICGFYIGRQSIKKGYLEGLKTGIIIIIIMLILTLIFKNFHIKNIIYYFIIMISNIFGAIIGIQKKKE